MGARGRPKRDTSAYRRGHERGGDKRTARRRRRPQKNNAALIIGSSAGAVVVILMLILFNFSDSENSRDVAASEKQRQQREQQEPEKIVEPPVEEPQEKPQEKEVMAVPEQDPPRREDPPQQKNDPREQHNEVIPRQQNVVEKREKREPEKQQIDPPEQEKQVDPPRDQGIPLEQADPRSTDQQYVKLLQEALQSQSTTKFLELAEWCKQQQMEGRMKDVYKQLLKIRPDNRQARRALGYVTKIRDSWVTRDEAARLGYYEYKGQWRSAEELKNLGLILYDGGWLTAKEAKEKGLVEYKDEWMTKEEAKKRKEEESQDNRKKEQPAKQIAKNKGPVIINFQKIRIISPRYGKWQSLKAQGQGGLAVGASEFVQGEQVNGLLEVESEMYAILNGFPYSSLITFEDGSSAAGDNIGKLAEALTASFRNRFADVQFDGKERRRRYRKIGTVTQFFGTGRSKKDNKEKLFFINMFGYRETTYAIVITYPLAKDSRKTRALMELLMQNITKTD